MKVSVVMLVAIGFLNADPSKSDPPARDKLPIEGVRIIQDNTPYYARVEVQGLLVSTPNAGVRLGIDIGTHPKSTIIPLNASQLKDWTEENLGKLTGKAVRVTGAIEWVEVTTASGTTEDRLLVMAKTVEEVKASNSEPAQKGIGSVIHQSISNYARIEAQGILCPTNYPWSCVGINTSIGPKRTPCPLHVELLKDWAEEKLRSVPGEIVRVSGTLELKILTTKAGKTESHLMIAVKTLDFVRVKDRPSLLKD